MSIPDEVRKCVTFVGFEMADGSRRLAGTAFFVSRKLDSVPDRLFVYVVTAKHVLEKIYNHGIKTIFLRMNIVGSDAQWLDTKIESWFYDPDDPTCDVAVTRIPFSDVFDHKTFPMDSFVTQEIIDQYKIGIGDEVFLTGLFAPHYGRRKNVPIVRVGNIAAMPHEKVSTQIGDIDAYLIEARSIGGLSGSPVFVKGNVRIGSYSLYLLGLMHGHFDSELLKKDATDSMGQETVNMGIGIVVPSEKIASLIRHPILKDADALAEEDARNRNLPAMDSLGDAPFTKADFEDALKKVSRRTQPSHSDEEK